MKHLALVLLSEYFSAAGHFILVFFFSSYFLQLSNILKYQLSLLKATLIQYLHHVSTFVHDLFIFKNDKTWEMRGYCDISSVSVALGLCM